MQIDFHHAVTYVVARLAGFEPGQASIIAHSAQYVDDATSTGEITFSNGAGYQRISSAHKTLDYRNFKDLENAKVWVPFHFLPGNGGLPAGKDPEGGFIRKLVCRPNSPVALDMLRDCIRNANAPYALHRLGIAMHVYADTWAHQGFAGVVHQINLVKDLEDEHGEPDVTLVGKVKDFFGDLFDDWANETADQFPLGHGAALSNPDKPFLKWTYTNGLGEKVERDNPKDFLSAARHLFDALTMVRIEAGWSKEAPNAHQADFERIDSNLRSFDDPDGEKRHALWLESIRRGEFSFGPEELTYIAKGVGSWKHDALGSVDDAQDANEYPFESGFLRSNWKLFHDALQAHRLAVLHDILPKYGICVA
jgi:hypothetical protein